jgi:hypothetical protein
MTQSTIATGTPCASAGSAPVSTTVNIATVAINLFKALPHFSASYVPKTVSSHVGPYIVSTPRRIILDRKYDLHRLLKDAVLL